MYLDTVFRLTLYYTYNNELKILSVFGTFLLVSIFSDSAFLTINGGQENRFLEQNVLVSPVMYCFGVIYCSNCHYSDSKSKKLFLKLAPSGGKMRVRRKNTGLSLLQMFIRFIKFH